MGDWLGPAGPAVDGVEIDAPASAGGPAEAGVGWSWASPAEAGVGFERVGPAEAAPAKAGVPVEAEVGFGR